MKSIISTVLFLLIFLFGIKVNAQKQANIWYFGDEGAGLDFNNECDPVVLTDGNMRAFEGCACISDANTGQLLFCTNSERVWNKNHDSIPNSYLLYGGNTITQVMIIPKPGSTTLYYIFTGDAQAGLVNVPPSGYRFHMVDMAMNNGLGGMVFKDSVLFPTPVSEKVTAIPHANGTDYWIIGHSYNSNDYLSFQVSASGVHTTPVISSIGKIHDYTGSDAIGEMKPSPNGNKIAAVTLGKPDLELFDFNKATGQLSNLITLPEAGAYNPSAGGIGSLYGLSFSPNNSFLYASQWCSGFFNLSGKIIQYNVSSNDSATIQNSRVNVFTVPNISFYSMKLAPDGKIYVAHHFSGPSSGYLGVINHPNSAGLSCNYVDSAIFLNGLEGGWGLNNVMEYGLYCNKLNTAQEKESEYFFSLRPNPAQAQVDLEFHEIQNKGTVYLSDLMGNTLRSYPFSGKNLRLDLSSFSPGIYLLHGIDEQNHHFKTKLIKQ
jgi:hypothetical protein